MLIIVETNSNVPTIAIVAITIFFEKLFSICVGIVTKLYIRIVDNFIHINNRALFGFTKFFSLSLFMINVYYYFHLQILISIINAEKCGI